MSEKMSLLHIYGQGSHHEEVHIIGNKKGLEALQKAIQKALQSIGTTRVANVSVNDGEGYPVFVLCNDGTWNGKFWTGLAVPYTSEHAQENLEDCLPPHEAIYKGLKKSVPKP